MVAPNTALRSARMSQLMSQDDLARALRKAGLPTASKRLVQRWEAGSVTSPRPSHRRALESVLRVPIEALGFGSELHFPGGSGGGDMATGEGKDDAHIANKLVWPWRWDGLHNLR
jgi:transcriptional regulator with XRE-family HTH domain